MLQIQELQNLTIIIHWIADHRYQPIANILAGLLHNLHLPLHQNILRHAHRFHGKLQLFPYIPCNRARLNSTPLRVLSQNLVHCHIFHQKRPSQRQWHNQTISITGSIPTSDSDSSLFMDYLCVDSSPAKNITAPRLSELFIEVNPRETSTSWITTFLFSLTSTIRKSELGDMSHPAPPLHSGARF